MKIETLSLAIAATLFSALAPDVHAQVSQQTLDAISAPERVETRLGTLEFKDGVPVRAERSGFSAESKHDPSTPEACASYAQGEREKKGTAQSLPRARTGGERTVSAVHLSKLTDEQRK